MRVKVKCRDPGYARGEHVLRRFEDAYKWLVEIRCLPRASIGSYLYQLARRGFVTAYTGSYAFEMESDIHSYSLADQVAEKVGLLVGKRGAFEPVLNPDRERALVFAKAFDEAVRR